MYLAVEDSMITAYDIFVQHVLKDQFVKLDAVDICEEVPQWMTNKGTLCHPEANSPGGCRVDARVLARLGWGRTTIIAT
jgi:hypothetical protein